MGVKAWVPMCTNTVKGDTARALTVNAIYIR